MTILVKIDDLDFSNKTVLIREDYNVPVEDGQIVDDTRIVASLPTLRAIKQAKAVKIILVSHLGRPQPGHYDERYSLAPVAACLSRHFAQDIPLIRHWVDGIDFNGHDIVLCENVRFEHGELENDDALARKMAALCQIYVNDAFATAHRAQASTYGIAKYVAQACAGALFITELKSLSKILYKSTAPVAAVIGGAKISGKLALLESLLERADQLIVGGGIANVLLKASGHPIGRSICEASELDTAAHILRQAADKACTLTLPVDVVSAKAISKTAKTDIKAVQEIGEEDMILDIGPHSIQRFKAILAKANTVMWNGPLGMFEYALFTEGTRSIAHAIADSTAYSVAGGGDTIAAISKYDIARQIDYISTGGGAFLEFMEGKKLPAVAILEEAARAWEAMERSREF